MRPMRQPARLPDMTPLPGEQLERQHSPRRRRWSMAIIGLAVVVLVGGSALRAAGRRGPRAHSAGG